MRQFSPRISLLLFALLSLLVAGCGDDKKKLPPPPTGDGTDQVDMMVDVEPDEGDVSDTDVADSEVDTGDISETDMDVLPDPPTVVIQSPTEPTALDSDQILPPSIEFTAICLVEPSQGGPAVDAESVAIEATAPDGTVLSGTVLVGENEGEYTADFTLPSEENGAVEISCSARDTGDPVQSNSDTVNQFIDFGPSAIINSPSDGAIITDGIVDVEIEVLASPIDNIDPDSGVDTESISVMVGTTPVSLTFIGNGTYTGTLDLEEESGPRTVELSATNQRAPDAITRTTSHIITLRPPTAPVVTITTPLAPTNLNSDEILPPTDSISVVCEAMQGPMGEPIDPASVTIELTEPNGNVQSGTVTPGPGADEYSAGFTLTSEENGSVSITCNASDTGNPVVSSFDTVTQYVDFGPGVTINSPSDGAVISDGLVDVAVQVQRSEIDVVDPGSAVDTNSVEVLVGGTPVQSLIFIGNGTYTGTVDLGIQSGPRFVEASAANQRSPSPVARTTTHTITLTPPPPPLVSITTPDDPANLNSNEILPPNPTVSVACEASAASGGLPLDSNSVIIELTEPNGNVQTETMPSAGPGANEFSADFTLTSNENGEVSITCSASDTGNTVQTSSDTVNQFVDFGPEVRFIQPADGSVLNGTIDVEVEVLESPVQPGDTAAAVDASTISVEDGNMNSVTLTGQGNGIYTGTYDLPSSGTQTVSFTLAASNQRQPSAVERSTSIQITADADAPSISLITPVMGNLAGGQQEIRALIQDADGINASTVEATINGSLTIPLNRVGMTDEWIATLDTSQYPQTLFDLLIVISADDNVGNSASTSAVAFELDNTPPVADLDPANIRVQQSGTNACSPLFDPLGSAPGSGDDIGPQPIFRAMVTDEANDTLTSQASGMNGGSVRLLLLNDESIPLVVDSDGDMNCDMVNPDLNRTSIPGAGVSLDALEEPLTAVAVAGTPDLQAAMNQTDLWPMSCTAGTAMTPPPSLCATAPDMTIVFADPDTGDTTIFAASPSSMDCAGNTLGLQSRNFTDGWICAALEVSDALGNTTVSAPIPLCVDLMGTNPCDMVTAPDCTGSYDPMTMTVDAAASCTVSGSPGDQVYSIP